MEQRSNIRTKLVKKDHWEYVTVKKEVTEWVPNPYGAIKGSPGYYWASPYGGVTSESGEYKTTIKEVEEYKNVGRYEEVPMTEAEINKQKEEDNKRKEELLAFCRKGCYTKMSKKIEESFAEDWLVFYETMRTIVDFRKVGLFEDAKEMEDYFLQEELKLTKIFDKQMDDFSW
ncbi:MAG: hypothetical protein FWC39_08535 [Bacteroidetes bacterium]|nr:hypothetical protein [Bacteroidota bacterium]